MSGAFTTTFLSLPSNFYPKNASPLKPLRNTINPKLRIIGFSNLNIFLNKPNNSSEKSLKLSTPSNLKMQLIRKLLESTNLLSKVYPQSTTPYYGKVLIQSNWCVRKNCWGLFLRSGKKRVGPKEGSKKNRPNGKAESG